MRPELTANQHKAAVLVAEDEITDEAIAAECGVNKATLERWKKVPEFQSAVKGHIDRLSQELSRYHIARKDRRMAAYQSRWDGYAAVIRARGEALASVVPGGETGLISEEFELDRNGVEHPVFRVDLSTSAEMRALEKQAAQEAGQWLEKHDHTTGGKSIDDALNNVLDRVVTFNVPDDINPFPDGG